MVNREIDFLNRKIEFDCMGCAIVTGQIKVPGGIIYEGKYSVLATDPLIPIPGFLVITFKRHVKSFFELNKEEMNEIGNIIIHAEKSLKKLNVTKDFTIVEEDRAPHFHIWIFPNYDWMEEKFGKGVTYLRDIMKYAKDNANENAIQETLNISKMVKKYFETHSINN